MSTTSSSSSDAVTNPSFAPHLLAFVILFAVLAVVAATPTYNGNGQPGCQTAAELSPNPDWRNNWDNTAFWRCEQLGQNAVLRRCEIESGVSQLFSPQSRTCVSNPDWVWEAPVAPPSEATL